MDFKNSSLLILIPLSLFLFWVTGELTPKVLRLLNQIPQNNGEFYGNSTFDSCSTNSDCLVAGCNEEICQGRNKSLIFSICVDPSKPTPQQVGYACSCVASKCQWSK